MRQRRLAAAAVLAAFLVVLAPVGVLADHSKRVVASQHTDFGTGGESSPQVLDNMTVSGSGDSASVILNASGGGTTLHDIVQDEGDGSVDGNTFLAGDTAGDTPLKHEVNFTASSDGTASQLTLNTNGVDGSDYGFTVDVFIVEGEGVDDSYGEGTKVATWDPSFSTGTQTIDIDSTKISANTEYTIEFVTSSSDNDGTLDALRLAADTSPSEPHTATNTAGLLDRYGDVIIEEGTKDTPASYWGANHSVDQAASVAVNMTIENASVDLVAVDPTKSPPFDLLGDRTGVTTTGNHTVQITGTQASSNVQVRVRNITPQSGPTTAEIHDVSVLFDDDAPTVDNASASPTGQISSANPTLSIDVNDSDFPLAQGDSVTAEFFVDGSSQGTDTLTSNGTASVTASGLTGGSHTWNVTVTDDHGLSHTSQDFSIQVPDELRIFNETDPGTLITSPTTVTVQFFAEDGTVVERTTTNGVVDMTGLPAGQNFVVDAQASGYHDRRIYVENLYEQQSIYLLSTKFQSADVVFSLVDESNQFSPTDETVLFVEKALTISGSTEYRVITSDQFSATNEVPVTLEQDQRYRLRLLSSDGDTRVLGAYRATGNDQATLTVGEVTFEGGNATNPAFQATLQEIDGNRFVRLVYDDPTNATTGLSLEVQNRTSGAFLRPNTTESGPFGRYVETIPISSTKDDVGYNVSYHADRDGYDDEGATLLVGDVPQIATQFGLDVGVLSMLGYLTILGVLGITCIAYPRYAGIPTVAVASFVVAIGVVDIHPLLLGGAGVISLIFAVGGGR